LCSWLLKIIAGLCVLLLGLGYDLSHLTDGRVHLDILDVGQGDSLLLRTPDGRRILIDGGPDGSALSELKRILPLSDQHIDLIVLTHPHHDHLAILPTIMRQNPTPSLLMSGPTYNSSEYRSLLTLAAERHATVVPSDPHQSIALDHDLTLDVLWPGADTFGQPWTGDVNNASVTMALRWHGRCLALLTGDLESPGEEDILTSGADIHCEILKVGHHGSKSSTSEPWLLAVRPQVAVISVGVHNSYGHPSPEVLDRLTSAGIPIHRTDHDGTVSFVWDR
jgi:competence protein ComEC